MQKTVYWWEYNGPFLFFLNACSYCTLFTTLRQINNLKGWIGIFIMSSTIGRCNFHHARQFISSGSLKHESNQHCIFGSNARYSSASLSWKQAVIPVSEHHSSGTALEQLCRLYIQYYASTILLILRNKFAV